MEIPPGSNEQGHVGQVYGDDRKCLLLIGTTGVGKSTLGNSLLGLDPVTGSGNGFETSAKVKSCTNRAESCDGFFMGNSTRPIKVIDTPGHGDSQGRDLYHRQSMVDYLKHQRFVHAFIWVKNSQAPKFDKQDIEHFNILMEMFGGLFLKNFVIVLTRFSHSEEARRIQRMSSSSLGQITESIREQLGDTERRLNILAIDALHNPSNQQEVLAFRSSTEQLWQVIQTFSGQPVENIKMVEDDVSRIQSHVRGLHTQMEEASVAQAYHMSRLKEEQEGIRRRHAEERMTLDKELRAIEKNLKTLGETQGVSQETIKAQMAERQRLEAQLRSTEQRQQEAIAELERQIGEEQRAHAESKMKFNQELQAAQERQALLQQQIQQAREESDQGGFLGILVSAFLTIVQRFLSIRE